MSLKSEVFNNSFDAYNHFSFPTLSEEQERQYIAQLFEQLMLFDEVTISTNRLNSSLFYLIKNIGINSVERLLENKSIKFMLWSSFIVTSGGHRKDDGSIDDSIIYGRPPIVGASLSDEDLDPEKNIQSALSHFNFHRDRKRIFTKIASNHYIIPSDLDFAEDSAEIVIESYKSNNLSTFGLQFEKEPDQLDSKQRFKLLTLGNKLIETTILSKYNLKSYDDYEHYFFYNNSLNNIGKALKISENVSELFKLENIPNLKTLFLEEKINFDSIFKLRYLSSAKCFRDWINTKGGNVDAAVITKEYLNEIKGNNNFFESNGGKFTRNIVMFCASCILGEIIAGPITGFGLGLFDTFLLDNLLKGNNPSIFIDKIRNDMKKE